MPGWCRGLSLSPVEARTRVQIPTWAFACFFNAPLFFPPPTPLIRDYRSWDEEGERTLDKLGVLVNMLFVF